MYSDFDRNSYMWPSAYRPFFHVGPHHVRLSTPGIEDGKMLVRKKGGVAKIRQVQFLQVKKRQSKNCCCAFQCSNTLSIIQNWDIIHFHQTKMPNASESGYLPSDVRIGHLQSHPFCVAFILRMFVTNANLEENRDHC